MCLPVYGYVMIYDVMRFTHPKVMWLLSRIHIYTRIQIIDSIIIIAGSYLNTQCHKRWTTEVLMFLAMKMSYTIYRSFIFVSISFANRSNFLDFGLIVYPSFIIQSSINCIVSKMVESCNRFIGQFVAFIDMQDKFNFWFNFFFFAKTKGESKNRIMLLFEMQTSCDRFLYN